MATKKEKRERALAKRDAFMENVKQDGLTALQRSREEAKQKEEQMKAEIERVDNELGMTGAVRSMLLLAMADTRLGESK
jgi:hypothetical protein